LTNTPFGGNKSAELNEVDVTLNGEKEYAEAVRGLLDSEQRSIWGCGTLGTHQPPYQVHMLTWDKDSKLRNIVFDA
jgi:hypothetical protein